MERITWNQFFMAQSHLLALRSTCTRLSVGATIVREKRIIAGGYNGSISGDDHCIDNGCYVVDNHCVRTVHAEVNALLQCAKYGTPTKGADLYVTHFPCLPCTKSIIQAGIQNLYYATDYKNNPYAIELLAQAKVNVVHVPFDERKIDFLSDEKMMLYMDMLTKLREHGATPEELAPYEQKVEELFGHSLLDIN
ncbi:MULTISPECIES: ComE operon protein 2 [Rummeliibacillus]|uniref:ComE operon protein 2 n=1 Tax=Rummeliibacillus stabekisii TaxID=241244 RepID=A0A143HAG0_9BACL|nr:MULTISPECIES: ComE operon protein 2 [Rummeliibacillus]AMW98704.1 competence protein ComE [Rummeliibacillus stabekisii]MBB5169650.1 dCMP deaminase [Rummeliibacillus stabekisii]MCM3316042.1 ComE operon protein 2 [Rummeliibacillus stabekisii]GEL03907.1 ComE operon protein 2 [Rummeliibacillus stabekisii]